MREAITRQLHFDMMSVLTGTPEQRLRLQLAEQTRLAELRGQEVAKWAHESGTAKGQRDRALKLAAFYKSCALSGEVPSAATIAEMEKVPE